MDEHEFRTRADAAIESLYRALAAAGERYDFDVDMNSGALSIEFDEPRARFVVSPNTPVRQVWVSALSRSFKLDWNAGADAFLAPESGQTLHALIAEQIGRQLGEEVSL